MAWLDVSHEPWVVGVPDMGKRYFLLPMLDGYTNVFQSPGTHTTGYPQYHRAVARLLRTDPLDQLPWHRVVGVGGEIKLRGAAAHEQRVRLKLEGVQFNGQRVEMEHFEDSIKPWEIYE